LNDVAEDVASLCDGLHTVEDIAGVLALKYINPRKTIFQRVSEMVDLLSQQGFIEINETPVPIEKKRVMPDRIEMKYPLTGLFLECTSRCNLNCIHCYLGDMPSKPVEPDKESLMRLIDQFALLGGMSLTISGGEPLLRKDIYDIISHAAAKPLEVKLFSNGLLINRKVAANLKMAGVQSVQISVDGAKPGTHDDYRGKKGSFEVAWRAIEYLQDQAIKVTISTIINKTNIGEAEALIGKCQQYQLMPSFSPQIQQGRATDTGRHCSITQAEYALFQITINEHISEKIGGKPFAIQVPLKKSRNGHRCGAGINALTVKSNGDIIPCVDLDRPEAILGNIASTSLEEVWNSEHVFLNYLRKTRFEDLHICPQCSHSKYCKGGCIAAAYRAWGDYSFPDPQRCAYFSYARQKDLLVQVNEEEATGFVIRCDK